ncbi:MAG TPA: extracellular solute-binding protein [Candidatus Udaeobacter sp.]|nr:extracellular solute-binding protein [Candidatus Udaeobacter sp.]
MSKSKKKLLTIVSSFIVLSSVLAGCGSGSSNSPAASNGQAAMDGERYVEPVTLKLLIDNQTSLDGIKAVAEEIENKYNIKTEYDLRPGGSEGDNLVKTKLATGEMDDLNFYNAGSLFKALKPEKYFIDLTNEPFMANVLDTFKGTVTVDGKIYGAPSGSSQAGGWLYNKKVYAELGLSVPKTWAELMANNEKIKTSGKTAVIGSYKDSWTAQLILLADYYNLQKKVPAFADDFTNNKAKFATTPEALRAFEKMQEIKTKGYMNEDYLATTYDTALKMLAEGTGVHYPMLTFALATLNANFPEQIDDIGMFAQPSDSPDTNGLTVWMPGAISISKDSKNLEAAKKWLSFFASSEGIALMSSKRKPEGPYLVKDAQLPEGTYGAVLDMMPYFDSGNTAPALEFLSPLKGPNLPQIMVENGAGMKTPEQSANAYDKDVEKQAKQLGIEGW